MLRRNDRLGFLKVVSADTETRRSGNQGVIWYTQCSSRVLVDIWRDFRSVWYRTSSAEIVVQRNKPLLVRNAQL